MLNGKRKITIGLNKNTIIIFISWAPLAKLSPVSSFENLTVAYNVEWIILNNYYYMQLNFKYMLPIFYKMTKVIGTSMENGFKMLVL